MYKIPVIVYILIIIIVTITIIIITIMSWYSLIVPGQSITSDDTSNDEQSKNFKANADDEDDVDDDDVIEEEVDGDDDDGGDDDHHEGDINSLEEEASSSSVAASSLTMDPPINPWASLANDAVVKDPTNSYDDDNIAAHRNNPTTQPSFFELAAKATKLVKAVVLDEYLRKYVYIMASKNVPDRVKAARTLDLLIDAFEWQQIRCRYDDDDDLYDVVDDDDDDDDDEHDDDDVVVDEYEYDCTDLLLSRLLLL